MTLIRDILRVLEAWAPLSRQENYDNAGLITGDATQPVKGIMVCLDSTEAVLDEAIEKGCNLVIAHHPIVFGGLKKITGRNYVERTVIKAIRNNIAIYAIHTNLDNVQSGVNAEICRRLGLDNTRILAPKKDLLYKLSVFVPLDDTEKVAEALFSAGAGRIGNYDSASFRSAGTGTFRPLEGSNPHIGQNGMREEVAENRLEVLLDADILQGAVQAMLQAHPYEEAAYDLIPLHNLHKEVGSGMYGELPQPVPAADFPAYVKERMGLSMLKYTPTAGTHIRRVAVCGGSGIFLLPKALQSGADAFITSDVKYHEFFDAEERLMLMDIGHYESEQYTVDLILRKLQSQFQGLPAMATGIRTNPVQYV